MSNQDRPIYINQTRRGIYSSAGKVVYQIATEIVTNSGYSGDTRDPDYLLNLFVNTIVSEDDHTQDTFSNYANLADLDLIPADRQAAINASLNKYRDNVNIISFDNLSVASSAAKVVRDTINNIVDTYLRVKDDFIGSDTYYLPYPPEVATLRDTYIQAYTASRDARISAESAQEEAQVAYNTAVALEEVKSDCRDKLCEISDILASAQTLAQLVGSKYKDTMLELIEAAEGAEGSTVTDLASLKSWLQTNFVSQNIVHDSEFLKAVGANSGTGLNLLSLILQSSYKAQNDCSIMDTNLVAAKADVALKLSDLNNKQEQKASAAQAEESSLGTLTIYCPNLDPASL